MTDPVLYRGVWPQNVSKLAKYVLKFIDGEWKVTVNYYAGEGLTYLAIEGDSADVAEQVNRVKAAVTLQPGGAFYVNEYRHLIVPVAAPATTGFGSVYYHAGRLERDFIFDFEGQPLSGRPEAPDGSPLEPGQRWVGPRPGIPYVLAAGGQDIYFESPALTDDDPPRVRPNVTRHVTLSSVLKNPDLVRKATAPICRYRGYQGGRFYVNEYGAMFTPVTAGDGNGLDYIYCGQIEPAAWFPEPPVE